MALAPISWGPPEQADTEGVQVARQATAQHEAVFQEARQLGENVQNGALQITQGLLHTQSLKATAAVKERQASVLSFIDSNPYVSKDVLQQRMGPDDYNLWHAKLSGEYHDAKAVPMFTAAGALFDSEAKQAREDAGQTIGLPGWRTNWMATEQTESATIRERYVNRMAADQMVSDQRSQSMLAIDKMVDSAVSPNDFETALTAAKTNPWFRPAERRILQEKVGAAKDSFPAEQAMLSKDPQLMQNELVKLQSDNAADLYPNLNEKQRVDLMQRVQRAYSFHGSKDIAEQLVSANTDERGRVDFVALSKAIKDQTPEVIQAAKSEAAERKNIFDLGTSDVQSKIHTAGQDPRTGEFDYQRARDNPAIAKLMDQLNQDAPGKLTALNNLDVKRAHRLEIEDRQEQADAQRKYVKDSGENLKKYRAWIDDPSERSFLLKLSPAQWDSYLVQDDMTPGDFEAARREFSTMQARGVKGDERISTSIDKELQSASNGNSVVKAKLSAKYNDLLTTAGHAFIRTNAGLAPDKMTDALRGYLKDEMLRGTVLGSSKVLRDDQAPQIDWETNPKYRGLDFKTSDGRILHGDKQLVRMSKNGETRDIRAENAAAARADGWE